MEPNEWILPTDWSWWVTTVCVTHVRKLHMDFFP